MKKMNKINKLISSVMIAGVLSVGGVGVLFNTDKNVTADAQVNTKYNGNYFFSDFDTANDAFEAGDAVNKEILSEGITLLKNENNSLPLAGGAKVSLFGTRSTDLYYNGAGSGAGSTGTRIDLKTSLERAGFQVNGSLWNFYKGQTAGGGLYNNTVAPGPQTPLYETAVSSVSAQSSTFASYSDAAIVVISRPGGENRDMPKGMSTGFNEDGELNGTKVEGARFYDDHYLQLDQNETDLIKYVGDNFDNVIVLFNTGSQFETGFLDDPGHYAYHPNVKGALWIGFPGNGNGLEAVGEILAGKTNPSGHTVDTWSRDFTLDPTWHNMATYTNNLYKYTNTDKACTNYVEGIYMGYRYYETRGYEEGTEAFTSESDYFHNELTTTTSWDNWYDAHVVYPFGHGLSYTTFDWEVVASNVEDGATLEKDATLSLDVKVTNTGDVAGKDVVQLYFTAPYTAGGIEKSYVELGAFEKTDLLDSGESQVVTIEMAIRDLASYDYNDANGNGFKGYEVEAGEYGIKLSRNAHDHVIEKTYVVGGTGYQYETSESGNDIENLFEDAEMVGTQYMSRADFEGTFPKAPASRPVASQEVLDILTATQSSNNVIANDDPSDPWYAATAPTQGVEKGIMLEDLYGLDYDDPLWEEFLNQLPIGTKDTVGAMTYAVWVSGFKTVGNDKFGIPTINHEDGPSGIQGRYIAATTYTSFASETVTASTWNKELAYKKGLIMGNQGLFGSLFQSVHALYAPACNIHRSAFSGRNFEYFSEDGHLSGEMAGNIVKGCNEKGMVTFIKHFALNDGETNRETNLTWANEQTMREIYLEPFRICVEDYQSHGMMTGLNNVGATWAGGNYSLITELLRNEWGFEGMVISDYIMGRGQLNSNQMIRAGGDMVLQQGYGQTPVGLDKPTTIANIRRSVHNICYTIVNYTAALNESTKNVLSTYKGGTLDPAVADTAYETSVANVSLNNGKSAKDVIYTLKDGSSLPDGLSLSEDGKITGTAALQSEAAEFTVVATYGTMAKREATFVLPIVDKNLSVIYVKQAETLNGIIGTNLSAKVDWAYTLDGKEHDITYRLAENSNPLPVGMTLSSDGTISGQPSITFTDYPITIVAESEGMLPMSITLKLNMYKEFEFASEELPNAKFGSPYVQHLGLVPYEGLKYSLKAGDGLPSGLSLTENGTIVGVPQEAGEKTFTVVVSGLNYETREQTFHLNIGISYQSVLLDDATKLKQYEAYVNLAQGANDIEYTVTDGKLPNGITLTKDGVLTGTPTESGNFKFTITAKSGTSEESVELALHVADAESYVMYYVGLIGGGVGSILIIFSAAVYVAGNNKKIKSSKKSAYGSTSIQKILKKNNNRVVLGSSSMVCILLATLIGFGVMYAPNANNNEKNTFVFEAEYVYLDDFKGAGISNSAEGVNNIYGEGLESDIEKGYSNGYFLGNTYAENTIEFKITSASETNGQLILRLASEIGNLKLDNTAFGVELNGVEIDYSITVVNSKAGSYDFSDYPIGNIHLASGENVIKLTIKTNMLKDGNSTGAPLIDCIKIATDGDLTWNPLTDNPSRRGGA